MSYTNIDDPSAFFQTVIWTGNSGSNVNVVNDGNSDLQPDFIWAKERTSPGGYDYNHNLVDSSRGVTKTIWIDSTDAEKTATQSNYDLKTIIHSPKKLNKSNKIELNVFPTTAGTGAEVTQFATIWDFENSKKYSLDHKSLLPEYYFLDSQFLETLKIKNY